MRKGVNFQKYKNFIYFVKLPTNITIDENNNINYKLTIKIDTELSQLIKYDKVVSLFIGEKWFNIPLSYLKMKENNYIYLKDKE
jgi:hypothetical protein